MSLFIYLGFFFLFVFILFIWLADFGVVLILIFFLKIKGVYFIAAKNILSFPDVFV